MTLNCLGEYRIIKELGRGGMGVVYLAEHQRLKKKYALKILPEAFAQYKQLVERFHTEARVMAQLDHPNIVQVLNMSCQGTIYYLVMEYVESETGSPKTLHDYVREQGGRLPEKEAERISLDILKALDYAHTYSSKEAPKGIIHRDIKPANVLLDRNGLARVSDFGLAKIIPSDLQTVTKSVTLTEQGAVLGTYDFMSPEQKEGKPVDARSDIYATGVIIYSMLTGKKPTGRFSLPSEIDPGLSKKWDVVIDKCLQYLPEKRFQSAAEVIKAIKTEEAPKPEKAKKARKEKKVPRGWFGELLRYSTIIIIVLIIAGAGMTYFLLKDKNFLGLIKDSTSTSVKEKLKVTAPEVPGSSPKKGAVEEQPFRQKIDTRKGAESTQAQKEEEPGKGLAAPPAKAVDLEKLKDKSFLEALQNITSALMKEGIEAGSKELSEQYKNSSDEEKLALDFLANLGIDFIKSNTGKREENLKDSPGFAEAVKKGFFGEGPLRGKWQEALNKMKEAKDYRDKGNAAKAQESFNQAQTEMRTLSAQLGLKQGADQAKIAMGGAKKKADGAKSEGSQNILYFAAAKAGKDGDTAYQKGLYSRAETFYTIAANIFELSTGCSDVKTYFEVLDKFIENTKARADAVSASSLAGESYNGAIKLEQKAHSLLEKREYRLAVEFYIESAFLYEKAREKAVEVK